MIANQTPADEYREIAGRFTTLVEGVPDDATWNRRSPVPAWTARDVVGHLVDHTWDLARATGQDETLDPQRCAMMLDGMQLDELLRSSGQYGPRIDAPDDADVQTKLLAFIGRDPR